MKIKSFWGRKGHLLSLCKSPRHLLSLCAVNTRAGVMAQWLRALAILP